MDDLIRRWHDALNDGDVDTLLALSDPDVAVAGPRGVARGHDVLADWARRAGIRLEPVALHAAPAGDVVVVAQRASWPGQGAAEPVDAASVFTVAGGRVASVARYGELAEAVAAAGIGPPRVGAAE
jgi:ketosteroid isomerase-like protein